VCLRKPVVHHGKTVPRRLKPINLASLYGTAEAVPFVLRSPLGFCYGFDLADPLSPLNPGVPLPLNVPMNGTREIA
jgi:hypothetical protein